ncbi:MAG: nucleoside phosphorylase [Ardenticatenaceae bacterium]|nr:nucleoside phosphorylase [Ardenticatenaceae bacterium]
MSTKILPVTELRVGQVSPAVLVCGDPARATKITAYLEDAVLLNERREYRIYQGAFEGMAVTVCSHGIGAAGAAIAFEELIAAGAKRIVRVGTCGGIQPNIRSGDLVIATAAVQNTGYGRETVPEGYPAVADAEMVMALRRTAVSHNRAHYSGIVITRDNFYAGVNTINTPDYQVMSQANVLAVEMECAALFIVGSLRGAATAAILAVDGNVLAAGENMDTYDPHQQIVAEAVEAEIQIALEALKRLESGA